MFKGEWSRSRYWLCHFLHNRHERPRINWSGTAGTGSDARAWQPFLLDLRRRLGRPRCWIIEATAQSCAGDPAYLQSLRLFLKEELHLANLLDRLLKQPCPPADPMPLRLALVIRQRLGTRFEWSVLLLQALIDVQLVQLLSQQPQPSPQQQVAQQIIRDREHHLNFHAERLTLEFADFNFLRRNLRRFRLRLMFAGLLATTLFRHHRLLGSNGISALSFALSAWAHFNHLLEAMVPYHRTALLNQLLSQHRHPYDKPAGHWA